VLLQLLVVTTQPGDVTTQQHAVHRQSAPAAVPVHRHLRAARHAAVRRQVQLRRQPGQTAQPLRHVLAVAANRLPGDLLGYICGAHDMLLRTDLIRQWARC